MPLDFEIIGKQHGPVAVSWTAADSQIYALGVGAGLPDPLADLEFTTETAGDGKQVVLPTFAIGLMQYHGPEVELGEISPSQRLHAEQSLTVLEPFPASGTVHVTRRVTDIWDKRSGALVSIESIATDPETGKAVAVAVSRSFIRGEGGFGGDGGPSASASIPEQRPDFEIEVPTMPNQALLFRQAGDRNSLHVDPQVAQRGGFTKPILHGLCTYGFAARTLLKHLCDNDPTRFRHISGRFSKPVTPGEVLTVAIWRTAAGAAFQVRDADNAVVIDRGEWMCPDRSIV
ncbi:MaoC/PaaZ C-terminal domain-containing protein [Nocardia sp. NPDC055029]